MLMKRRFKKK